MIAMIAPILGPNKYRSSTSSRELGGSAKVIGTLDDDTMQQIMARVLVVVGMD